MKHSVFPAMFAAAILSACSVGMGPMDGSAADYASPKADGGMPATDGGTDAGAGDTGDAREPDQAFFDPVSDRFMLLNFKGLINSYQDLVDEKGTEGIGEADITIPPAYYAISEMPMAFTYTFPADYPNPSVAGRAYIIMDVYKTRESTDVSVKYDTARLYFGVEDLTAIKTSGGNEMKASKAGIAALTDLEIDVRKDKVVMRRICYAAVSDPDAASSKYFVNHEDNASFSAGENFKVWGNVAMTADNAKVTAQFSGLVEDGGRMCRYYMDSTPISKEEYGGEIKKTFDLECGVPAGFLDPFSADYGTFMFRGPINDFGSGAGMAYGAGEYKVMVGGKALGVGDYSTYAGAVRFGGKDYTAALALGSVQTAGTGRYKYKFNEVYCETGALETLKKNGGRTLKFFDNNFFSAVHDVEQKSRKEGEYYKQCALAVMDDGKPESSLYVCHENNTSFAAGENLQAAGNFALTTGTAKIAEYVGTADGCLCYDGNDKIFDCSGFDAL